MARRGLFGLDVQSFCARTQELLGWQPMHQGIFEVLDGGHDFGTGLTV